MRNHTTCRIPNLRKGRVSHAGARYFVTFCAVRPDDRLVREDVADILLATWDRLELDGDMECLCATIMPDHVHGLLTLSDHLTIYQVVGKFKALAIRALKQTGIRWQENFFDHRLRPEDSFSLYARYIYLNPYRKRLCDRCSVWPYWRRSRDFDFEVLLEDGKYPPKEWLDADWETLGLIKERIGED